MSRPSGRSHPLDVDDRLPALVERLGEIEGAAALYLYGSYGTPAQTPMSDIDLALVLAPERRASVEDETEWGEQTRSILGTDDASLVVLNRSPVIFAHKVLREGHRLACWNEIGLADYVERLLSRHADYFPVYQRFLRDYDAALLESFDAPAESRK